MLLKDNVTQKRSVDSKDDTIKMMERKLSYFRFVENIRRTDATFGIIHNLQHSRQQAQTNASLMECISILNANNSIAN